MNGARSFILILILIILLNASPSSAHRMFIGQRMTLDLYACYEDGSPASNASVKIYQDGQLFSENTTDAKGKFTLVLPGKGTGKWHYEIAGGGHKESGYINIDNSPPAQAAAIGPVLLVPLSMAFRRKMLKNCSLLMIVLILACGTSDAHRLILGYNVLEVQVSALYDDGTAAGGVDINVMSNGKSIATGVTDGNGAYIFRPEDNGQELEFIGSSAGHRAVLSLDLAEKKQQDEITLPLRLAAGLGYLLGLAGIAMIYLSKRGSRKA